MAVDWAVPKKVYTVAAKSDAKDDGKYRVSFILHFHSSREIMMLLKTLVASWSVI